MNTDLVTNIKPIKIPFSMSTNAGTKKTTLQGDVNKFGDVLYEPTQLENIFVFSHLADKHRTSYNNWKEDAFLVHSYAITVK